MSSSYSAAIPPRVSKERTLLILACLFIILSVITVVVFVGLPSSLVTVSLVLVMLLIPISGVLIAYLRAGHLDIFEPVYGIMGVYILSYPIRAIYAYILKSPVAILPLRFVYEAPGNSLDLSLLYASLGLLAFLLVYFSKWPESVVCRLSLPRSVAGTPYVAIKLLILFLFGVVFVIIRIQTGVFSVFIRDAAADSATAYLIDLASRLTFYAPIIGISFLLPQPPKNHPWLWTLVGVMWLSDIIFALLGGAKLPLLLVALGCAIPVYYLGQSSKRILVILLLALLVLSMFPFVTAYRSYYLQTVGYTTHLSYEDWINLTESPSDLVFNAKEEFLSFVDVFLNRTVGLDSLLLAVKYTPEVMDFQYGQSFLLAPLVTIVPRAIWPDKPSAGLTAEDFTIRYVGMTRTGIDANWAGGTAITPMADLYMNFHVVGIVLGMCLFGLLSRSLWLYMQQAKTPVVMLVYVLGYMGLVNLDSSVAGLLVEWPRLIILFWLMQRVWLWGVEPKRLVPYVCEMRR